MTQQAHRLGSVTRDRRIRHPESGHFGAPAIVAVHRVFGNIPGDIGNQLGACGGQFGGIGCGSSEQDNRRRCDAPLCRGKLAVNELCFLPVGF